MLYFEYFIIVTISKLQLVQLISNSFGNSLQWLYRVWQNLERKKGNHYWQWQPPPRINPRDSGGLYKTLLSTLSEDEGPRWTRDSEKMHPYFLSPQTLGRIVLLAQGAKPCLPLWAAGFLPCPGLVWGTASLHTRGDRTLLGTQPPMPHYVTYTAWSEKITMAQSRSV